MDYSIQTFVGGIPMLHISAKIKLLSVWIKISIIRELR